MQKIIRHKTNLLYIEDLDRLLSEDRASVFMLGLDSLQSIYSVCSPYVDIGIFGTHRSKKDTNVFTVLLITYYQA
jgi:hypothetical protein